MAAPWLELNQAVLKDISFNFLETQQNYSPNTSTGHATTMATGFELDPFAGAINPANSDGRKLFLAATKECSNGKNFTMKQYNANVSRGCHASLFKQL